MRVLRQVGSMPCMKVCLTILLFATSSLCFSPMNLLPSRGRLFSHSSSATPRCRIPLAAPMTLTASSFNQGASVPKLRVAPFPPVIRSGLSSLLAGKEPEPMEEEEDDMEVMVRDPKNGKTIDCYVDEEMEFNGNKYALVYPCDRPVVIARVDGEGDDEELVPVEDETLDKIFKAAYKACADEDVELIDSAVVLTLQGELDDDDEEEEEQLKNAMGEPTEEEEFVRVITSFNAEDGQEYLVTEPLEPVLIIAKPVDAGKPKKGKQSMSKPMFVLLDDKELDQVMPSVETFLQNRYIDEED